MAIETTSVDELLARIGLTKKPGTGQVTAAPSDQRSSAEQSAYTAIPSPNVHLATPSPSLQGHSLSTPEGPFVVSGKEQDSSESRLEDVLQRLQAGGMTARSGGGHSVSLQAAAHTELRANSPHPSTPRPGPALPPVLKTTTRDKFWPRAPRQLSDAGIAESELIALILKYLMHRGVDAGSKIAQQTGLRFPVIEPLMRQLKADKLVIYKSTLTGGDYQYELTDLGRDRARQLNDMCTYYGSAPVPLSQYIASVHAQTITGLKPPLNAIRHAMADLNINDQLLSSLGQAIHSGRGMFLFGAPGNGKTSIAERVTKSFGDTIWIPKCLSASGEVIRLYDPNRHKHVAVDDPTIEAEFDGRWVQIERPTIVVGGELRMENLEITVIRDTGIGEAPLQLKANCGTLLIDDFGRQRMPVDELLNRWIIPLEQRHDFLQLESGRCIQVPFDELVIFSTNLEPRDLVDDAFLRRIPYKIEVKNPSEDEYRELMLALSAKLGFVFSAESIEYLIRRYYLDVNRPFRFCHPRDLLRQIENYCSLHEVERVVTQGMIDQAVSNYFSIL